MTLNSKACPPCSARFRYTANALPILSSSASQQALHPLLLSSRSVVLLSMLWYRVYRPSGTLSGVRRTKKIHLLGLSTF